MKALKFLLFFVFVSTGFVGFGQVKEFDKLEMLYDQANYKMVYRKANALLDNPEFDFSLIPTYYKSLALFQLSQQPAWYKRNPESLEEAKLLFTKVKNSKDGTRIFNAHIFELAALKKDLYSWSDDLKRESKFQQLEQLKDILEGLFENVPDIESDKEIDSKDIIIETTDPNESKELSSLRENLLKQAKKQLGTPYQSAGNDPKGFDCSGFTSYIHKLEGKQIPRRAVDQHAASKKLKQKQVQTGDLIFFDSGAGINHVGMIVSAKGEPLLMIHASSSKGIVITEVETSSYWSKRIAGFGTFIE
jgi:cell wall-associated NlpC family hydrolase